MGQYIALYTRISPKPNGKGLESCNDQEVWGRAYADSKWPGIPVRVYRDELISGADEDREDFQRFRNDLAVDPPLGVWSVEQSRLCRDERLWFTVAAEMEAAGLEELHTDRDGIVRLDDEIGGIKAVIYSKQRRRMLKQQAGTLGRIAARGEPPGSKPFGYEHGVTDDGVRTYVIVPEQADAIRFAAEKVLAGWSSAYIAEQLRKKGVKGGHRVKQTVTGKRWYKDERNGPLALDAKGQPVTRQGDITPGAVRTMVTNPSVAGLRVHQGRVVGPGNWPAILDEDTWKACRRKLEQPRRVKRRDGGEYPIGASHIGNPTGRKYLLTGGLAVCGVCEAGLIGALKQLRNATDRRNGTFRHQKYLYCSPNRGGKACVGIMLDPVEDYVVNWLLDELDKPEFLRSVELDAYAEERKRLSAELDAIDGPGGQREELATLWATKRLRINEWQSARQALDEEERQLRTRLAAIPPPIVGFDVTEARASWPDMELPERREFLRIFIERVTIHPAKPGTKGFDSDRVQILPRDRCVPAS